MRSFETAYNLLPHGKIKEVRAEIMARCEWATRVTFYDKKRGSLKLHPPEQAIIKQIFARYQIDAETGQYLAPGPVETAALNR